MGNISHQNFRFTKENADNNKFWKAKQTNIKITYFRRRAYIVKEDMKNNSKRNASNAVVVASYLLQHKYDTM